MIPRILSASVAFLLATASANAQATTALPQGAGQAVPFISSFNANGQLIRPGGSISSISSFDANGRPVRSCIPTCSIKSFDAKGRPIRSQ
jgi:hypothetical protein